MSENKEVILVKLGGGLIAPKDWDEETADMERIEKLVQEIKAAGTDIVVAVGSGNFGHKAVKKYGLEGKENIKKVREVARKIGQIVVAEMKKQGLDGELVCPNQIWKTRNKEVVKNESELIVKILNKNKIPVVYGDVIDDEKLGAIIFSGETCLETLIPTLVQENYKIRKIIQISLEEGVLDKKGKVVEEITIDNWEEISKLVKGAAGVDVTGGMLHKVEKSLEIAKRWGIETWIVSGKNEGRLTKILRSEAVLGTRIN